MQIVSESSVVIRFPDCDPFNHLNNSKYIDYFINAREDHLLKDHHFSIYSFAAEKKLSWVVSKNQIAYFKPAFLMETVLIQTTILKFDNKEILVEMKMLDSRNEKLKAILWTTFTHYNLATQRSENHSEELTSRFKPFENCTINASSFEERLLEVSSAVS